MCSTLTKFSFRRDLQVLLNMNPALHLCHWPWISALADHSPSCGWDSRFSWVLSTLLRKHTHNILGNLNMAKSISLIPWNFCLFKAYFGWDLNVSCFVKAFFSIMKLLKLRPRSPISAVKLESRLTWALAEYTLESLKKNQFDKFQCFHWCS